METWTTQEGETIAIKDMKTNHIFHVVRMIYNHSVEPSLRIPICRRYPGIETWDMQYKRDIIKAMMKELSKRKTDIAPWQVQQLYRMRNNLREQKQKKITV